MKDPVGGSETEYHLPCAEALLAGTLALMTGHAQSTCPRRQEQMAARIIGNMDALVQQSAFSPQFRVALQNLRTHWQALSQACGAGTEGAPDAGPRLLH